MISANLFLACVIIVALIVYIIMSYTNESANKPGLVKDYSRLSYQKDENYKAEINFGAQFDLYAPLGDNWVAIVDGDSIIQFINLSTLEKTTKITNLPPIVSFESYGNKLYILCSDEKLYRINSSDINLVEFVDTGITSLRRSMSGKGLKYVKAGTSVLIGDELTNDDFSLFSVDKTRKIYLYGDKVILVTAYAKEE
jgi:hypothetical protein